MLPLRRQQPPGSGTGLFGDDKHAARDALRCRGRAWRTGGHLVGVALAQSMRRNHDGEDVKGPLP